MTSDALGSRHPEVKRLRALARDRQARATEATFLLEGPRLVAAALDRGATLDAVYLGYRARPAFESLVQRARDAGVPVRDLSEGVLEKVGVTRTPQPVLATAPIRASSLADLGAGDVLVVVDVADPGNLGTMVRSAEASGAAAVIVTGDSVDAHNPKTVRSSAGAVFGLPIIEARDTTLILDELRATGRRSVGATAHGGHRSNDLDLGSPIALVVGNEARGLDPAVQTRLDDLVTIPTHRDAESLNVAMAATVLLFELDRRRATNPGRDAGAPT